MCDLHIFLTFCMAFVHFYCGGIVTLVLPLPDPLKPEQHEPWCPLGKKDACVVTKRCFSFFANILEPSNFHNFV